MSYCLHFYSFVSFGFLSLLFLAFYIVSKFLIFVLHYVSFSSLEVLLSNLRLLFFSVTYYAFKNNSKADKCLFPFSAIERPMNSNSGWCLSGTRNQTPAHFYLFQRRNTSIRNSDYYERTKDFSVENKNGFYMKKISGIFIPDFHLSLNYFPLFLVLATLDVASTNTTLFVLLPL